VCVAVENFVGRHDSPQGRFIRQCLGDDPFVTSTGYRRFISASGRQLGPGDDPEVALARFLELPESERGPGAVQVPQLQPSLQSIVPTPPEGGLIVKIYGRMLSRTADGSLRHVVVDDFPLLADLSPDSVRRMAWHFEAHPDYLWLTRQEWQSLVPEQPETGRRQTVSEAISERIARFHLIPQRVYAEGGEWHRNHMHRGEMAAVVEYVSDDRVELRLEGRFHLGSEYDAATATTPDGPLPRGYDGDLVGRITYDRRQDKILRFDAVVIGDSWGRMGDANNRSTWPERPLRNPLAFSFSLVTEDAAPQHRGLRPMGRSSKLDFYFNTGRDGSGR
jgi:hypothetical protein